MSSPPSPSQQRVLADRDLSIAFLGNDLYKINHYRASLSVNDYIETLYGTFDRYGIAKKCARSRYYDCPGHLASDQKQLYILSRWNVDMAFGVVVHNVIDRFLMRKLLVDRREMIKSEVKIKKEEHKKEDTESGSVIPASGLMIKIKKEEEDTAGGSSVMAPDGRLMIKLEPFDDQENVGHAILGTSNVIKDENHQESSAFHDISNRVLKRKLSTDPGMSKFPKMEANIIIKIEKKEDAPIPQPPQPLPVEQLLSVIVPVAEIIRKIIETHYNDRVIGHLIESSAEPDINRRTMDVLMHNTLPDFRGRLGYAESAIIELMQLLGQFDVCATNYMVWDSSFKNGRRSIAGTIDCLLWKNYEQREVIVVDWTTKKKLDYPSVTDASGSPFDGRYRTKLHKCFCQLHVFAQILEKCYAVKVVGTWVVQIGYQLKIHEGTVSYAKCQCSK